MKATEQPQGPTLNVFRELDVSNICTPAFVVDEASVEKNLAILRYVADHSGAKVLSALKAFSMWKLGGLVGRYLDGTCASGINEALLGREEYGGEVHAFSAAFSQHEFNAVAKVANHIVFNSLSQWERFKPQVDECTDIQFGLRINPEHSEGAVPIYDPCSPGSRLGITLNEFEQGGYFEHANKKLKGISGLHFHSLCEQGYQPLARTLDVIEEKFGHWIATLDWVNFGGGHHITQTGYEVDSLISRIQSFAEKYQVQVYLEPGEAIAINTGILVTEILDIRGVNSDQLILDTSATCHMPDVLEMPYRPEIMGAGQKGEKPFDYRLGGMTCLAGDTLGEYSFDRQLHIGDKLVFMDMAHYTMVKTTTFNGINLPDIVLWNSSTRALEVVRRFGYEDFKHRLS